MNILTRIVQFVKIYKSDMILGVGVVLISLLSFATGYLVAKERMKGSISIQENVYEERQ